MHVNKRNGCCGESLLSYRIGTLLTFLGPVDSGHVCLTHGLLLLKMNSFLFCARPGRTSVTELDCKEQCSNIQLLDVDSELTAASEWRSSKRRWRMKEIVWSVHHLHSKLDRRARLMRQVSGIWLMKSCAPPFAMSRLRMAGLPPK